jgi:cell division inhibitor SepF
MHMAGVLNKLLSIAGIYNDEYPTNEDEYDTGEYDTIDRYPEEDYDHDGGTLNERLRGQGTNRSGGAGGAGVSSGNARQQAKAGTNNSVNLHPNQKTPNYVLVSAKPERIEDAQLVCDHLKERHVVIVNVEGLEGREAQRIVDFICGAVYSLEGEFFDITNRIFAIAPSNVDLVAIQRDTKNRGFLSFGNSGSGRG